MQIVRAMLNYLSATKQTVYDMTRNYNEENLCVRAWRAINPPHHVLVMKCCDSNGRHNLGVPLRLVLHMVNQRYCFLQEIISRSFELHHFRYQQVYYTRCHVI